MTKHKIILCFVGTDGSGKSTLAYNIFENFHRRGIKVRKTYGRFQPMFCKLVIAVGGRLFLKNRDMLYDYDRYLSSKQSVYRRVSILVRIYFLTLIVEYYFQLLFKIIIPHKFFGYTIISDRYVYDTIINDLAIDGNLSIADIRKLLVKFWHFVPKPDLVFLVQVPVEVAFARKRDIPSLSYLQIRNRLYKEMAESENLILLDGTIDKLVERTVMSMLDNFKL